MGASLLLAVAPAHAAKTFTVNSNLDCADLSVGDGVGHGVCDARASGGELCTLRAAIQGTNHPNNVGADFTGFGSGAASGSRPSSRAPSCPR